MTAAIGDPTPTGPGPITTRIGVDWESVFIRYVAQVAEEEGVTFFEDWRRGTARWPNDAEWAAIQTAVRQASSR